MTPNLNFHDKRRLAPWWMCLFMLLIAAFFGWVISETYGKPVSPGVWSHIIIPPYFIWLYLVLACLLDKQAILATADRIVVSTGPIRLGLNDTFPRDRIAFCYHYSIVDQSDGATATIGHVAGIETREGRQVVLVEPYSDPACARTFAETIAAALNQRGDTKIEVRALQDPRPDPVGTQRAWLWAGIWIAAFASGIVWELLVR